MNTTAIIPAKGTLESVVDAVIAAKGSGLVLHADDPNGDVAAYFAARRIVYTMPWTFDKPRPRRLTKRDAETIGTLMVTTTIDEHNGVRVVAF